MLVSTLILLQFSNKTSVAREWRVVTIPSEDTEVDIGTFFQCIIDHVYDPLEPFHPTPSLASPAQLFFFFWGTGKKSGLGALA